MAAVFASLFLLLLVLIIAPFLAYVPIPAMAGLILFVAYKLISFREIKHVLTTSRSETVIVFATILVGVFIELELSLFIGVMLSLMFMLHRTMKPLIAIGAPDPSLPSRSFRNAEDFDLDECPQMMVCRFSGPLYFGSAEHLESELQRIRVERPEQKTLVVDLKSTGDMDLTGIDILLNEGKRRREDGGDLHLIAKVSAMIHRINRYGLGDWLGEDHLHDTKTIAIQKAVHSLNDGICETCSKRVFKECATRPGR